METVETDAADETVAEAESADESEEAIAAETEQTEPEAAARAESRMVVIGNSTFATDGLFAQQLNGDVFLNSVNWLSKIDSPVLSIRPKAVTNRRFEITGMTSLWLTLLALIVFPLVGLAAAGTLWVRRR